MTEKESNLIDILGWVALIEAVIGICEVFAYCNILDIL